jgi:hypothetical protein
VLIYRFHLNCIALNQRAFGNAIQPDFEEELRPELDCGAKERRRNKNKTFQNEAKFR